MNVGDARCLASAALVVIFGLVAACTGWCQIPQVVPVTDKSDIANVLQFSGNVSYLEQFVENESGRPPNTRYLETTSTSDVSAKNVSGRRILLVIATLDTSGSYGCSTSHSVEHTDHFWGMPLEPGKSIVVSHGRGTSSSLADPNRPCANPDRAPSEPKADARTVFVQFDDGSTLGDQEAASDVLNQRASILKALKQLDEVYAQQGEQGFLALLSADFGDSRLPQIVFLRETAKQSGSDAAIQEVRRLLQRAERNQARFAAAQ
jgi:hypothetical protein